MLFKIFEKNNLFVTPTLPLCDTLLTPLYLAPLWHQCCPFVIPSIPWKLCKDEGSVSIIMLCMIYMTTNDLSLSPNRKKWLTIFGNSYGLMKTVFPFCLSWTSLSRGWCDVRREKLPEKSSETSLRNTKPISWNMRRWKDFEESGRWKRII